MATGVFVDENHDWRPTLNKLVAETSNRVLLLISSSCTTTVLSIVLSLLPHYHLNHVIKL